ncbi:MAG: cyclic nucleotide-binding domain-containing protein [Magnetococcales bacterium]|nr:cyclic nucleotide-binding domain-containing protein [Magnetococcales bacterium]MBF0439997.1 cyclic nucleotide-binding domain-containing protein [Magnetococcales bacterium]
MFDVQFLDKIKFFSDFSAEAKREIAQLDIVFKKYAANSPIINEGDDSGSFFILLQGKVSVYKKPNVNPISELLPGAIFGEIAFLSAKPRGASVVALENCILLEFDRSVLGRLSPDIRDQLKDKLITILVKHLNDVIDMRTKESFGLATNNPHAAEMIGAKIEVKQLIFSQEGYYIYYMGNGDALIENRLEGTKNTVKMVELTEVIPGKYITAIKQARRDPADYLFGKSGDFGGYLVLKAARQAWKSTLLAVQAEKFDQTRKMDTFINRNLDMK